MADLQKVVEQKVLEAAKILENEIDEHLEKLDCMDEDDFGSLREKRLKALKNQEKEKQECLEKGHGEYSELPTEKEFFDVCKNSKAVVCHFYRDSTFRCKIVDKHLSILAKKHWEAKFCKINAEKSPFLTDRLKIRILPTIVLCIDGKTIDFIIGFDDLGGSDDFSTDMMAWRLAQANAIRYNGEPTAPVTQKKSSICFKKNIRGGQNDSSDED